MGDRRDVIESLIEASSLGTKGAKLLRARTSASSVEAILGRAAQLTDEHAGGGGASAAPAGLAGDDAPARTSAAESSLHPTHPHASPAMVGRGRELRRLHQALEAAAAGRAQVVVIAGESGVGKTRLLTEFVTGRSADATMLVGGCLDLAGGASSHWGAIDALRFLADLSAVLPTPAGFGSQASPSAGAAERSGQATPQAQRELFGLALSVLRQVSERGPVVLAVEDIQWSDRRSQDLLICLVRKLQARPFLFVATYRSDAVTRGHPLENWLAELVASAGAELLELQKLTKPEVAAQIRSILGTPAPRQVLDAIWERSEGNALFVEELLAATVAGCSELPRTLRQVLLARVEAFSSAASLALGMVAAAWSPVRHELLAAVGVLPEEALLEALDECVHHRVLVLGSRGRSYAFRHSLLKEIIESRLASAELAAYHRAFAEAIDADRSLAYGSAPSELAWHWFQAGDAERELHAAIEAAEAAEATFGYAEAWEYLERAVALCGGLPGEAGMGIGGLELGMRAAELARLPGSDQCAVEVIRVVAERLEAGEPPIQAAAVWERLGRWLRDLGATRDALMAYAKALELTTPAEDAPSETQELLQHLRRLLGAQPVGDRQEATRSGLEELLARAEAALDGPEESSGEAIKSRWKPPI